VTVLSNDEIRELAMGRKVRAKAVRGKKKGGIHTLDMLAGAVAILCKNNPNRNTVSNIHTQLLEAKIDKKYGRSVSRAMISARMAKLYDIGFIQMKKEPVIRAGTEDGERNVYFIGEAPAASAEEREMMIGGKMTETFWNVTLREAWEFFGPTNKFDEAIFDIIADTSDMSFPLSLEEYRTFCISTFQKELEREHRVIQLNEWARKAFPTSAAMTEDSPINYIVRCAKLFTEQIWEFVKRRIDLQLRLANSQLPFNQDEYDRLAKMNPDFYKSVSRMRREGKLAYEKTKREMSG